jgi:hypothetical protein
MFGGLILLFILSPFIQAYLTHKGESYETSSETLKKEMAVKEFAKRLLEVSEGKAKPRSDNSVLMKLVEELTQMAAEEQVKQQPKQSTEGV